MSVFLRGRSCLAVSSIFVIDEQRYVGRVEGDLLAGEAGCVVDDCIAGEGVGGGEGAAS